MKKLRKVENSAAAEAHLIQQLAKNGVDTILSCPTLSKILKNGYSFVSESGEFVHVYRHDTKEEKDMLKSIFLEADDETAGEDVLKEREDELKEFEGKEMITLELQDLEKLLYVTNKVVSRYYNGTLGVNKYSVCMAELRDLQAKTTDKYILESKE